MPSSLNFLELSPIRISTFFLSLRLTPLSINLLFEINFIIYLTF
ncbi:hypothetical protein A1OE_1500 [Candidatus Endolissoclinum faulkneri L2]|uniref:Uncharacterized protein n=1 Tax=Candidatus Endolissoclinum faulkneri L2 TaxID=1193729 RepID=K7YSW0_9PROT|nr:hypothetical protein A1OE_1500 [Candidatus Endolissoclinum faulkneri L2]